MATYSLSSLSPDYSPEAAAAAERSFIDTDAEVQAAKATLQAIATRLEPLLLRAALLGTFAPSLPAVGPALRTMTDAIAAADEIERAAHRLAAAELAAQAQWRGHLALGCD